jgi:hypothetical protein
MAGFPREGKQFEIGHAWKQLAGPVSLSLCFDLPPGPGPQQVPRQNNINPANGEDLKKRSHAMRVPRVQAKRKIATNRPGLALGFRHPVRILRWSPGRRMSRLF